MSYISHAVAGLIGTAIGGAAGFFISKRYWEKKCNEEIIAYKKYMNDKYGTTKPNCTVTNTPEEKTTDISTEEVKEEPAHKDQRVVMGAASEESDPEEKVDYMAYSKRPIMEKEERVVYDKHTEPYLISIEDVGTLPDYEEDTLLYYVPDDILTSEMDEIIEDPAQLVGDALTKFGFKTNNKEKDVWVRCPRPAIMTEFHVVKVYYPFNAID